MHVPQYVCRGQRTTPLSVFTCFFFFWGCLSFPSLHSCLAGPWTSRTSLHLCLPEALRIQTNCTLFGFALFLGIQTQVLLFAGLTISPLGHLPRPPPFSRLWTVSTSDICPGSVHFQYSHVALTGLSLSFTSLVIGLSWEEANLC